MSATAIKSFSEVEAVLMSDQGQSFLLMVSAAIIVSIIVGVLQKIKTKKFMRNSLKVTAMIIEVYKPIVLSKMSRYKTKLFSYDVGFLDYNGKECFARTKSSGRFKQTDKVEILYLKADPSKIKFNKWADLHFEYLAYIYMVPAAITIAAIYIVVTGNMPKF
jgi:hypothetical protein